jgi:uncharacterized protein (AIM24 family)
MTSQFRYIYLEGPCRIWCFGRGGVETADVTGGEAKYDKASTIGWTNGLLHGVGTSSTFWSAFMNKEEINLDTFEGKGTVLYQCTSDPLNKSFNKEGKGNFRDYASALLGLSV